MVSVDFVALAQERELFVCLSALGDNFQIELLPKRYNGGRNRPVVFVLCQVADEGLIDFKSGYRQALQGA